MFFRFTNIIFRSAILELFAVFDGWVLFPKGQIGLWRIDLMVICWFMMFFFCFVLGFESFSPFKRVLRGMFFVVGQFKFLVSNLEKCS